jgi:hypothetical protein
MQEQFVSLVRARHVALSDLAVPLDEFARVVRALLLVVA